MCLLTICFNPSTILLKSLYQSRKVNEMYMCVGDIDLSSFDDFTNWLVWNCSDSVTFFAFHFMMEEGFNIVLYFVSLHTDLAAEP